MIRPLLFPERIISRDRRRFVTLNMRIKVPAQFILFLVLMRRVLISLYLMENRFIQGADPAGDYSMLLS